jgi:hypothetical protein
MKVFSTDGSPVKKIKVFNRGLRKIAATISGRYCRYSGRYSAAIATL